MTLKIFLHLNIMTKCTILKYLSKFLSLFRLNACFLGKKFYYLQHLLNQKDVLTIMSKTFDIIAIIETRNTKQLS